MIALTAFALALAAQGDPDGPRWEESGSPLGAVLSNGQAANATIVLTCIGRGMLRADLSGIYTGDGAQPRNVVAASGRTRATYRLVNNEGFSASIPATAPVMRAFGQSGRLAFRAASGELEGEGQASVVAGFLRRCR